VRDLKEAMKLSNEYAPEHLILQIKDAASAVDLVQNAGSVFIGEWTPESVGDYSAGVNHSLRKFPQPVIFQHAHINTMTSDLRLREAILGCQPSVICEAYHQLEFDRARSSECRRRRHAAC
jgi:hypothetical protein